MGTARDIALIFLSLEALAIAIIPLLLLAALAYGIYRLRLVVKQYLVLAQTYALKIQTRVEQISHSAARPLIQANAKARMATTIIKNLTSRRSS
jgi:hypothetical protein